MKFIRNILFCFFLSISVCWISACKKERDTGPNIIGTWVGEYGFREEATGQGFKFFINAGGDLGVSTDTMDITPAGKGTWNLTGNTFRATYIYTINGGTFSVMGNLNNNTIEGTWGDGSQTDNRGRFSVKKK